MTKSKVSMLSICIQTQRRAFFPLLGWNGHTVRQDFSGGSRGNAWASSSSPRGSPRHQQWALSCGQAKRHCSGRNSAEVRSWNSAVAPGIGLGVASLTKHCSSWEDTEAKGGEPEKSSYSTQPKDHRSELKE